MRTLMHDLRYGARMLLKAPGFTLIAALAIALGVGAVTTIFSAADATMLRPFSFPNQDRLVMLFERKPEAGVTRASVSPGNVIAFREQSQTLQEVVVMRGRDYTLTGEGPPERYASYGVSAAFFDALGAQPQLGRTFRRDEDEEGNAQVVVLRHAFWQTRFGGDPKIIGKQLKFDDKPFEVIGVMPRDFEFPYGGAEMWTPFVIEPRMKQDHGNHYLRVMALLKPGVTMAQANDELRAISDRIQRQFPDQETGHIAYVEGLNKYFTRGAGVAMPALIGAAIFVLLIACSNVANLLLARAATRRKEMGVRLAMGATRWRLMRQLLIESVTLATAGGALGCLIAVWGVEALVKVIPEGMAKHIPGWNHLGFSYDTLFFTASVSILTGVLFGLAPAWQATKTNLNETLKEGGDKGAPVKSGRGLLRNGLVVSQLAIATVLVIGAGVFVRSFIEILRADLGIKPDHVVTMNLGLPRDKYPEERQRRDFFQQLIQRIEALPGVTGVGAISMLPMSDSHNWSNFQIVGQPAFEKGKEPPTEVRVATPGYFAAIGTELRKGRLFNALDDAQAPRVALVNEVFAARYLKGSDAVGQQLRFGDAKAAPTEIIGVVANVMNEDLDGLEEPGVYFPFAQFPSLGTLVIRAPGVHTRIAPAVRNELAALDPRLPITEIKAMELIVYERRSPKEVMMWMLGAFAVMALLMAAVGTYAVMAFAVAQRTREIGVRMALGALPADILKLVLRRGLSLVLLGIGLGLAGAFAMTRALEGLLYKVSATDPLTFIVVSLPLALVALLACYVPARRAMKVDPMVALRCE
ncbi:MAG TPA: ABC transporter permease [Blastocatellia bacterium]|nr:ABC transporter permease [Blastocatellia bacterium]